MSSTKRLKNGCSTCGKMVGIFACRGCSGNFCLSHTKDHRDHLQKSLDEIVHNYEQLKRNLKGQTAEQYQNSLIEQIDQWERVSIEKIHRLAQDTRQELDITVKHRTDSLKEKLEQLKQQFDKAQQDGGYYENDLKEWTNKLNELQRTYVDRQTLKIDEDSHSIPFITRIALNDCSTNSSKYDYQCSSHQYQKQHNKHTFNDDNINGDDDIDKHQSHGSSSGHKEPYPTRNQTPYKTKKAEYPYKLEGYEETTSILIGIISESASDSPDPYNNPTFYGWGSDNRVYFGGQSQENYHNYHTDFQPDDICVLTVDPDQDKITLKNQRTNSLHQLDIDRQKCAYPWQLHVRLYNNIN